MTAPETLLPCPFCGGNPVERQIDEPDTDNDGGCFIECSGCGASTNLRFPCGDDPWPLLREQWNRRADRIESTGGEAKPAAWRYKLHYDAFWCYDDNPDLENGRIDNGVIQPLYTSATPRAEVIEACAKICDELVMYEGEDNPAELCARYIRALTGGGT